MKIAEIENPKLAIVGMDSCLGSCNGLEALERSIYDGTQHFITVPPQRWQRMEVQEQFKDYSLESGKAPLGAYIKALEINLQDLKLSSSEADKLTPQSLLMLKVADNALRDAGLEPGKKVAVILATATELSVQQLQQKWNFIGPSFTFNSAENSAFKVIEVAQELLFTGEVDAVLVGAVDLATEPESILQQTATVNTGVNTLSYDRQANGWMISEGAIALVLKLHETAKQANDRIYAVINAITRLPKRSTAAEAVTQACQQAFHLADIKPKDIGYLEVCGSGIPQEDESEIEGLIQAYQLPPTSMEGANGGGISGEVAKQQNDLSCAIGSVKANLGHTHAAADLASLVKTALCLYHRYIPATPQWSGPKMPQIWQGSPFYVAAESRPWFLETGTDRRAAAINSMGVDGTYAHLILSEEPSQSNRSSKYLEQMPFYLFAIAADDRSSLLEQINALQQRIEDCSSLSAAASLTFAAFQQRSQATYALAILGHNKDELKREIQRAVKGVANAFDQGEDWQTPVGSYFTAKPLGKKGKIAFVYPGAYNSYVGLARNLFHLFPRIYDDLVIKSVYSRVANIEKLLYPRSLNSLSRRQLESLEKQLLDNPLAMLESETGFAGLITAILKDYFKVQPQSAFGYSLGETSMMFAQGVWTSFNQLSDALNSSQLFSTRLSGAKNAVREYWGLPQGQNHKAEFWSTYVLMAPASQVRECLKHEKRVYLTQINTPKELIIAGDTQACMRMIESLKCDAFRAPFNHVIHCLAMNSEYDELVRLNTLPTQSVANITFYSAAEYKPITLDSQAIAHNIAKALCQQLDFPELVNRVYKDDAKIFIETGVGSNCSRWIDEILKQKEHVTISLNRRGIDDHTSIVKALAKLLSHRVNLDLSPLYSQVRDASQSNSNFEDITLNGDSIPFKTTSDINKEDISSILLQQNSTDQNNFREMNQQKLENSGNGVKSSFILDDKQEVAEINVVQENHQSNRSNSIKTHKLIEQIEKINLLNPQYQKLNDNNSRASKIHAAFLQARQDSLQQISEIIQTQIVLCQQVLDQTSPTESKK
ncbi:PfaB family protein [Chroococcidiopsis sp. CCMEE 29]|uniref:PfaB family protein n=1 Tax=Chroococcidiopsis sp. CCMEE 29 TaxID=155894 RepID=UPI0020226AD6|nr:PfaB family protein [Chroococcidiopsis sp. CCMEE 29]